MKKFTLKYITQTLFVLLLVTQISFAQWVRTNESFSNWIYAFTSNGSNLFFGMDSVYLSTDNGTNWSVVNSGLPTTNLYIISFGVSPDGANLFAGTMNNGVFLTTNNGTSWTEVNSGLPENGWVSDFAFCSNSRGGADFFVETRSEGVGGVFLSTNNGINWNKISTGILGASSLAVIQSDEGQTNLFVGGTYGAGLLRLTEKDTSWIEDMVITNNSIFSLAVSGTNLFASTYDGVILSTDNGTNWTMVNQNLVSIDAFSVRSNGTNFLIGVGTGGVYISTNNGTTWTDINEGFPSNIGVFKFAVSDTYIFAATDSGVWRRPLTEITTSAQSLSELPELLILKQNYPNPFSTETKIKYSIFKSSNVTLKVFDIHGKTIDILVNEKKPAGTYEVTWYAGNLPGGVYFYQLNSGGVIETKKMLLHK